ncbi:MAG: flavin reductase family protein [Lautropia sp.]
MPTTVTLDGQHDTRQLRHALGRFPTGVTVITACSPEGRLEGLTANSFSALSLEPPLVLWSLNSISPSLPGFLAAGHFAIHVLDASQTGLSHRFATSGRNKYDGLSFERGLGGAPILGGALATFECTTETTIEGGDHRLFVGRIGRITWRDGEPLIFNAGRYCTARAMPGEGAQHDLNSIWAGLG